MSRDGRCGGYWTLAVALVIAGWVAASVASAAARELSMVATVDQTTLDLGDRVTLTITIQGEVSRLEEEPEVERGRPAREGDGVRRAGVGPELLLEGPEVWAGGRDPVAREGLADEPADRSAPRRQAVVSDRPRRRGQFDGTPSGRFRLPRLLMP